MPRHRPLTGFAAVGLTLLSACAGNNAEPAMTTAPPVTPPPVPFEVSLAATDEGSSRIRVSGTTNLRGGTVIRLSASREQRLVGETDLRASFLGEHRLTVSGSEFSAVLTLSTRELLAGLDPDLWAISHLARDITVCAEVQTGVDLAGNHRQPSEAVRQVIGTNGEAFANSSQSFVFGSMTDSPSNWLRVQTSVRVADETVLDEVNAAQAPVRAQLTNLEGFCL